MSADIPSSVPGRARPAGRASPGRRGTAARSRADSCRRRPDWVPAPGRSGGGPGGRRPGRAGPATAPRGRENSRIATLPPGRATRISSSIPRTVSRTFRKPNATVTTPNVSSGNGSCRASPSTRMTRPEAPAFRTLRSGQLEHLAAEVGPDDRRSTLGQRVIGQRQVGRARAAVEHGNSRLGRHDPGRERPPGSIDVQAQQVVEQIVPLGDRGEHRPHPTVGLVDPCSASDRRAWRVNDVSGVFVGLGDDVADLTRVISFCGRR